MTAKRFTDGPRCGRPKARTGEPCQQPAGEAGAPCAAHREEPSKTGNELRPPFAKGNTLGLKAGHRSARIYEPIAQELACGLLDEQPWLEDFPEAVAAWAEAEARAQLLRAHVAEVGLFDPATGEPRDGVGRWLRWMEGDALKHRERLGLDPQSDVQLQRGRAQVAAIASDLDGLLARGREVLDAGGDALPTAAEVVAVSRG